MRLNETVVLHELHELRPHKKADKIVGEIFSEAKTVGVALKGPKSSWKEAWLASERFTLARVPVSAVACPVAVRIRTIVGSRECSIVVDVNKRGVGKAGQTGYVPPVIVVSGQQRFEAAVARGDVRVNVWIGELAARRLRLLYADHQLGANELRQLLESELTGAYPVPAPGVAGERPWITEVYPLENYFVYAYEGRQYRQHYTIDIDTRSVAFGGEAKEVVQKFIEIQKAEREVSSMKLEQAMNLYSQGPGSTSLSDGSGAGREQAEQLMSRARGKTKALVGRHGKKGMHGQGYQNLGREKSETTEIQKKSARGGSKSEMQKKLLTASGIGTMLADFRAACKKGYKPKMTAKSPPGCEALVKALKREGKVTNPWAVAHWAKSKGRC